MSGAGQGSEGDMKRGRDSTGGGPLDQVLEKGTAGPIEQEAVDPYAHMHGHESDVDDSSEKEEEQEAVHPYAHMHGHESDVDDSSEEEEEETERPVKKRKGPHKPSLACREQGCDKWAQTGGLCVKHGGGWQKPCSVEGCGTLANSRGLCVKHGGGSKKPCSVDSCDKQAQSGNEGMCKRHFKEMN